MMVYIGKHLLKAAFEVIYLNYAAKEEVPHYPSNIIGMERLYGVLTQAQSDIYYPTLLDKAAFLFVSINKGHFFSNGNKRLALVIATLFIRLNNKKFKEASLDAYKLFLKENFNIDTFEDDPAFHPEEFALYNLSIIVADSHKYIGNDFDTLKEKVRAFFEFAVTH